MFWVFWLYGYENHLLVLFKFFGFGAEVHSYICAMAISMCTACSGNNYYCTGGVRRTVSSGYYSTGGTSTTRTGQSGTRHEYVAYVWCHVFGVAFYIWFWFRIYEKLDPIGCLVF